MLYIDIIDHFLYSSHHEYNDPLTNTDDICRIHDNIQNIPLDNCLLHRSKCTDHRKNTVDYVIMTYFGIFRDTDRLKIRENNTKIMTNLFMDIDVTVR